MKGKEGEGKRHPRRLQVYSPSRKPKLHRWRLPCWGTVLFPLQIVKGYHVTARHLERPRDPKTRTRRQETSAPYFARHSDRRLWLGRSGAFNRCAHVPTVQRLIGIYTARNPRTFRHTSSGVVLHVPTLERLSMRAYTRQSRLRYGKIEMIKERPSQETIFLRSRTSYRCSRLALYCSHMARFNREGTEKKGYIYPLVLYCLV